MKKFLLFLLIPVFACLVQSANAQGVWTQKSDFGGTGRHDACGFSIGTKGYLACGNDNGVSKKKDCWEYDQAADTWSQKADCGAVGREKAASFSIGTKGYVACGNDGSGERKDCYEYDQGTNTWTPKTDFGGTAREGACAFTIGTKGYIACGNDGSYTKDCWEFDPSGNAGAGSWTQKLDFGGTAREMCTGFSIGTKGYIGCGKDISANKKDFWEYDQAGNTWTQKTDFGGTARYAACSFAVNSTNRGYITCGDDGSNTYRSDCWQFDQASNTWNQLADFSGTGRYRATSFCIGGKGYVACGKDYNLTEKSDCWELADCNAWYQKANYGGTARWSAFAFAINNKGYVGTGYDGLGPNKKDVWEYNPTTDTWAQKADFGGTPRHATYSFAINTKGYVGGGWDGAVNNNDLWEYDQPSNTWTSKASLPAAGRIGALGIAINGKGYVGTGNTGVLKNDWYEYNPGTNTWATKASFPGTARSECSGFTIGNFGYVGNGYDASSPKKDFYKYDPVSNTWSSVADCGTSGRYQASGFSLCNKGYVVNGNNNLASPTVIKEFWEYDPSADTWARKQDYGGQAGVNTACFVIGCSAYVGLSYNGTGFTKEFWQYVSCCCAGSGGVGGGSGGGLESKNIGDGIAKRILNNAKSSLPHTTDYNHTPKATHSMIQTMGTASSISLASLMPDESILGTGYTAYVTTPTDITSLSNAVDVMAQDYVYLADNKAVAFATKTLGAAYSHTKPVCDRLKEATLLNIQQVSVQGMSFLLYTLQQADGTTEFAISFSAGMANAGKAFNIQSIWLPYNVQSDDIMYNFEVWAVNAGIAKNMVSNILDKLSLVMPLNAINAANAGLPAAYVVNGMKKNNTLSLTINNTTAATSGFIELSVDKNEQSASPYITNIPVTLTPNGMSTITLDMKDYYDANINLFVNNKQEDLVYLNDGTWALDYNKNNTTLNSFNVSNNNNFSTNTGTDFNLFRNVSVDATTSDYVTLYKLTKGGGLAKDLSQYDQLSFTASGSGAGSLKITIIKSSITNWNDQYNYTIPVDASQQNYTVDLSKLTSTTGIPFNANDVIAVDFSFLVNSGNSTHVIASVSNAEFTNKVVVNPPIASSSLKISRNPNKGDFTLTYNASNAAKATFRVYDAESGMLIMSKVADVITGINTIPFSMNTVKNYSNFVVQISGEGIVTDQLKFVVNKNQ